MQTVASHERVESSVMDYVVINIKTGRAKEKKKPRSVLKLSGHVPLGSWTG